MNPPKRISIIGGGLAGLSLGIGLRRVGIPVTVWEAGAYPRHRVCGEFISGRGQDVLERLGLSGALLQAGAVHAKTTRFFLGDAPSPPRTVRPAALCLSRYRMDAVLAREFRLAGGELYEHAPHRDRTLAEGVVRATGRRVQPVDQNWRWFGLKIHARNVRLDADLEMHCLPNQYVGLGRIEEDRINVCGLFRRRVSGPASRGINRELLFGPPASALRQRLENAVLDDRSFCAVAGLPLKPQCAMARRECVIGDALTMIPPATGNGMSMAFEAAELAVEPLAAFSRNELSWEEARREIAAACDRLFHWRLRWAGWLQRLLFLSCLQHKPGSLLLGSESFWNLLFARTR